MAADDDDLIEVDLEDIEREFLVLTINEYGLSAQKGIPLLAPLLGAATEDECWALIARLKHAIRAADPLSDYDWARALLLAEVLFGSELLGAGLHFAPALDAEWLDVLRAVQRKIASYDRFKLLLQKSRCFAGPTPPS